MSRNKALNRIECPNPKKCVIGHWDALKLDFAAKKGGMAVSAVWRLVYFLAPCRSEPKEQTAAHRRDALCPSTQTLHKISARQIPWQFHGEHTQASAKLSSRTKCRRMALGIDSGASKKYPFTASAADSRREIQSSPCVTIGSVKHSATNPPSLS